MKLYTNILFFSLLVLILAQFFYALFLNRSTLFSPGYEKQYSYYKQLYGASQYVRLKDPVIIEDYIFRSYAGGAYLKGMNPIMMTHDHPPLGNYLIAASIFLFDNPRTLMVPLLIATLLGIYLLSKKAIRNRFFALLPLAIFANEPILLNKIAFAPLIEPIQFPFILFAFYFYLQGLTKKHYIQWFVLTSLCFGIVISTRFFVTGAIMLVAMLMYMVYKNKVDKRLITFIATLPLAVIILVLSYTKTMLDGASLLHVFGIQKYILAYHKSKFILPFTFWDLLLFNKWHTWWGSWGISSDPQWSLLWPISVLLSSLHIISEAAQKVKLNDTEKILFIWLGLYTLTLSIGYSSTNYFLPILPFLYILAVSFIAKVSFVLAKKIMRLGKGTFLALPIFQGSNVHIN